MVTAMKLNKRLKKVFWEHKASYIGMILLITMSTSVFLGFKTSTVSITKNVADNRAKQKVEDAHFETALPISEKSLENLEKEYTLELQTNPSVEIENGYNKATLKLIPEAAKINLPKVYTGEYLASDSDILVDRWFFQKQRLSFGDKITLFGKRYTVKGTFTTPDTLSLLHLDTDFVADGTKFGLILMTKDAFGSLPENGRSINYSVRFTKSNEEAFRRALAKISFITEWVPKGTNKRITTFDSENQAIVVMSYVAPLFLLIVSTIMLAVVLSRMLKKEYTYIGTLSAMGYKKREILAHYLRLPVLLSLAGAVVGIIIGYFLIEPFSKATTLEYNVPKPDYTINSWDIAIILFVPLLFNGIAVALSVWKALRHNIVSLLKSGSAREKRGLLTRLIPHKRLPFKVRFRLKEITSNLPRSFLMIIGIAVSSLFLITGFLFYSSMNFLFDNNFNDEFGYAYQYSYKTPQIKNNTDGEPFMMASYYYVKDNENINFTINGVPENARFIRPKNDSGEVIDPDKTIVTKSAARRLGWKKGDTITIVSNSDLSKATITIDEICNIRYSDYVYIPLHKLNFMLRLDENTHIGVYSDQKLDIDDAIVSDILTKGDSEAGMEASVAAFRVFLYILGAVSGVISFIVIYIVTIMLIDENRKNISMLKVMGYQNKAISRLLLHSNLLLVFIGYGISVPLTLGIIDRFFDMMTASMFFDFQTSLALWQGLLSFGLIIGVYYLTLLPAKRKVLNINMAESLKASE